MKFEPYARNYTVDELISAVWMLAASEGSLLHSGILAELGISPLDRKSEERLQWAIGTLKAAGVLTLTKYGEYVLTWDDREASFASV